MEHRSSVFRLEILNLREKHHRQWTLTRLSKKLGFCTVDISNYGTMCTTYLNILQTPSTTIIDDNKKRRIFATYFRLDFEPHHNTFKKANGSLIQKWLLLRYCPLAVSVFGNVWHRQILPRILRSRFNEILYTRIHVHRTIDWCRFDCYPSGWTSRWICLHYTVFRTGHFCDTKWQLDISTATTRLVSIDSNSC